MENAVWVVPAERMKAKREHRVPLSARAVAILQEATELADGLGLVFSEYDRAGLERFHTFEALP